MTLPLLKNHRITALMSHSVNLIETVIQRVLLRRLFQHSFIRKNLSLQPGDSNKINRRIRIQSPLCCWGPFAPLAVHCFLLVASISAQAVPDPFADRPLNQPVAAPRQLVPPVHIPPGSVTSQPVERFRSGLSSQPAGQSGPPSDRTAGSAQRISQRPADSNLQRTAIDPSDSAQQLPSGPAGRTFGPTAEQRQRQVQGSANKRPQSVLISEPVNPPIPSAAIHSNRNRTRPTTAASQNIPIPSQMTAGMARQAGHQSDDLDGDLLIAMLEQSLDELWADDRSRHNNTNGETSGNSGQSLDRPSSVLDWEESSIPTFSSPASNQVQPGQRGMPRLIPTSPPPNSRHRQNLDEFEFPAVREPASVQRGGLRSLIQEPEEIDIDQGGFAGDEPANLLDRSCDYYRSQLFSTNIQDIGLDISPPRSSANSANQNRTSRNWTDRSGNVIASGKLVDMQRGYVILDNGQRIAYGRLGEPDLIVIADYWNLPRTCGVADRGNVYRSWHPMTYAYTASSVCHKPLYFENIQLERYGHSHGPLLQPIHSVAHFFVRLATLPYHTALHPANECEYPLGLYRPGDCAPWLKDPIPFSLSGFRRQALVTGGWIGILP
jgi:hypothetical protein